MRSLMDLAKNERIQRIYLMVLTNNLKAIHMYKKYGFKGSRIVEKGDIWHGKEHDCVEMYFESN